MWVQRRVGWLDDGVFACLCEWLVLAVTVVVVSWSKPQNLRSMTQFAGPRLLVCPSGVQSGAVCHYNVMVVVSLC